MAELTSPSETDRATGAAPSAVSSREWRLRKHADYQRVYAQSRKQFATSMTYFAVARVASDILPAQSGPRVGLTTGRVLGKAVDRNRIKRRMRAAVRRALPLITQDVDVVLHPRRDVLAADFNTLRAEVERIFRKIASGDNQPRPAQPRARGKRA